MGNKSAYTLGFTKCLVLYRDDGQCCWVRDMCLEHDANGASACAHVKPPKETTGREGNTNRRHLPLKVNMVVSLCNWASVNPRLREEKGNELATSRWSSGRGSLNRTCASRVPVSPHVHATDNGC